MFGSRPILGRLLLLLLIGGPSAFAAWTLFHQSDSEKVIAAAETTVTAPSKNDQRAPGAAEATGTPTAARQGPSDSAPVVPEAQEVASDHSAFDMPNGVTRKEGLLGAVAEVSALVADADPVYLMALADKESNFVPHAESSKSTATGLYQFTEATWLETVKRVGPRYGLQHDADSIRTVSGRPVVDDPAVLKEILDRRNNPTIAAIMAAEKANYDKTRLERQFGRKLNHTETYIAHLLGTGSAAQFIKLMNEQPNLKAADAFPKAAENNGPLFYRKTAGGREALTIAEVFGLIDKLIAKRLKEYAEFHDPESLSHAYTEFDIE